MGYSHRVRPRLRSKGTLVRRTLVVVPLLVATWSGLAATAGSAGAATAAGVGCAAESGMSWAPVTVAPQTTSRTRVSSLAIERNTACNRIVFEAQSGVPGYALRYVDAATAKVSGAAALEITLTNVSSAPVQAITPGYSVIRQLRTGSATATSRTYLLGVSRQTPFLAYWLKSPTRLVIDFASVGTVVQSSGSAQVSQTPTGAMQTGGGSTAGVENPWLFGAGGLLLLLAGALLPRRRRAVVRV